MKQENIALLSGFWDRVNNEINKQHKSKKLIAEKCKFNRRILNTPKQNDRYIRIVYFARLCTELNVSADYLLFGEEGRYV